MTVVSQSTAYNVHTMEMGYNISESVKELLDVSSCHPNVSKPWRHHQGLGLSISHSKSCLQTTSCGSHDITRSRAVVHCGSTYTHSQHSCTIHTECVTERWPCCAKDKACTLLTVTNSVDQRSEPRFMQVSNQGIIRHSALIMLDTYTGCGKSPAVFCEYFNNELELLQENSQDYLSFISMYNCRIILN